MSNNDSFIDEVTDELRRDRFFAFLRRYGWIAALLVLLLVGGAAFTEWRTVQAETAARNFGDTVVAALELPDEADRKAALAKLTADTPEQALLLALVRSGSGDGAALAEVAANAALPPLYRDLATLKLLMINTAALPDAERKTGFQALAAPGAPFRLIALEQIALIDLGAGDRTAALAGLKAIAEDSEVSPGLQTRAQDMITTLGGTPGE